MFSGDYRAVTIRHGMTCCRSATVLHGKRFLAGNAPRLPLANCSMPGLCECSYQTLHDRRSDQPPGASGQTGLGWLKAKFFGGNRDTRTV